ncbi:MAG: hypothetical protein MI922_10335 [Bacteroidales bacterium]|nr:hypothetical protein [Bacteroidales bacterium]
MERQKCFFRLVLIVSLICITTQLNFAQHEYRDKIYDAYSRGKMHTWYLLMKKFETETNYSDLQQSIQLVNYYYGYTAWLIGNEDNEDIVVSYIEYSEDIIDKLLEKYPKNATLHAYKGAFIAFEIGLSNYKAIYLGKRSMNYIEKSLELEPENVQGLIEMGNAMYYCPATFGGDKTVAIGHYKKAIAVMEKKKQTTNNWLYLNIMTTLGLAYEATNQIDKAKLCYEKILKVRKDFMWVGEELYPDLLKRHNL